MGSESDVKDFEVKKARTRTRSKTKQDTEEDYIPLNDSGTALDTSVNGTELPVRKTRGKKSLPSTADTHEEGAENNEAMTPEEVKKPKRGKRSASKKAAGQDEGNTKDSPSKRVKKDSTEAANNEEEVDEEETTNETKKPKKPSKRQIKREKAEQRESLKREASKLEATERALNYVSKWKHAKSEWKFEKLRQIWLMDNLLDDELIPDDIFPTVLEYFEGCIGMAREQLLKKGMDVIKKREETEAKATDGDEEEVTESVEYRRARQLLQALPTES